MKGSYIRKIPDYRAKVEHVEFRQMKKEPILSRSAILPSGVSSLRVIQFVNDLFATAVDYRTYQLID